MEKKGVSLFLFSSSASFELLFSSFCFSHSKSQEKKKTKKNKKDIKARRPKNKHGTRSCVCHLGDGTGRDIEKKQQLVAPIFFLASSIAFNKSIIK
jgi:hypothetical protein